MLAAPSTMSQKAILQCCPAQNRHGSQQAGCHYGSCMCVHACVCAPCRKYNAESGRRSQISGRSAITLKYLFDSTSFAVVDQILLGVSKDGWDKCAWSAENLANKKVYPGHQFVPRGVHKGLLSRLVTTEASMMLFVRRTNNVMRKKPMYMKKKPDSHQLEALAERAAFVSHIAEEVPLLVPITEAVMREKWLEPWAEGD